MFDNGKSTAESASESFAGLDLEHTFVIRWVFPDPVVALVTEPAAQSRVVGRDPSCDTVLPGTEISRRHAEFRRSGPLWLVRDLESKNGLFVNGQRVESAVLGDGDVVRVGEWLGIAGHVPSATDLTPGDLGGGMWGGIELRSVVDRLALVAPSDLPVVLVGQSGTGKELLAAMLHRLSLRPGAFVAVNCASYTPELAAAELFGHRQGAFTGATRPRTGHIQAAARGTLFLDEIADLPLSVQPQLLRVLEQREVLPLGESRAEAVDVRFVCASQVPLAELVAQGRFRADLRARLEGVVLTPPPLRERRADIAGLFSRLLGGSVSAPSSQVGDTSPTALVETQLMERLCCYDWPLNVRELSLVTRRLKTLLPNAPLLRLSEVERLVPQLHVGEASRSNSAVGERRDRVYPQEEIDALTAALAQHRGNVTRAAEELQITRQKAYRLLQAAKEKGA